MLKRWLKSCDNSPRVHHYNHPFHIDLSCDLEVCIMAAMHSGLFGLLLIEKLESCSDNETPKQTQTYRLRNTGYILRVDLS